MIWVFLFNCLIVAVAVMIHYECLYRFTFYFPKMTIKHRSRIVFGVFGALIAHSIEIWVFALAYYWMNHSDNWGKLVGTLMAA